MQGKLSKRHPAHVSPVVPHEAEHVLVAALLSICDRISHPSLCCTASSVWPQLWTLPRRPAARLLVKKRDEPQAQVAWRPRRPKRYNLPFPAGLPGPHCVVHRQQGCPATGDTCGAMADLGSARRGTEQRARAQQQVWRTTTCGLADVTGECRHRGCCEQARTLPAPPHRWGSASVCAGFAPVLPRGPSTHRRPPISAGGAREGGESDGKRSGGQWTAVIASKHRASTKLPVSPSGLQGSVFCSPHRRANSGLVFFVFYGLGARTNCLESFFLGELVPRASSCLGMVAGRGACRSQGAWWGGAAGAWRTCTGLLCAARSPCRLSARRRRAVPTAPCGLGRSRQPAAAAERVAAGWERAAEREAAVRRTFEDWQWPCAQGRCWDAAVARSL